MIPSLAGAPLPVIVPGIGVVPDIAAQDPAVVVLDRAAPEIARLLAQDLPARTALRRWVVWMSELLPLVRQRRRRLLLVERQAAGAESQRLRDALAQRLGEAMAGGLHLPEPGERPDPVLEVIAQALVAADPAARAADAEIAALLLPGPADTDAEAQAQLALASAAARQQAAQRRMQDDLRRAHAELAELRRLDAERLDLLAARSARLVDRGA